MKVCQPMHKIQSSLCWGILPWCRRASTIAVPLLGFGMLMLNGCGKASTDTLRVGISTFPPYEQLFLAQELGYFAEEKVNVQLVEFDELHDARLAFEKGNVDGVTLTLNEVLVARDGCPRDLRVTRVVDSSEGTDVLIGGPKVPTLADLRGKRVAVELGAVNHYLVLRALERAGIPPAEITLVGMQQHTFKDAMLSGQVDAVATYPPYSLEILAAPSHQVLFSSRDIPGEILDVIAFDQAVMKQNPHLIRALNKALDRAWDYLQNHRAEACRIMARRENISEEEFCAALEDGLRLIPPKEQAALLGPQSPMRPVVDSLVKFLRDAKIISTRAEVAECLIPQ